MSKSKTNTQGKLLTVPEYLPEHWTPTRICKCHVGGSTVCDRHIWFTPKPDGWVCDDCQHERSCHDIVVVEVMNHRGSSSVYSPPTVSYKPAELSWSAAVFDAKYKLTIRE